LMALYISLELASLPLYLLASFERDSLRSTESGVKYFVLGAIASGIMLFGSSLLYGFTGSLSFSVFANLHSLSSGALLGLVLVITGFCFKISAAPFHNWTPDVYQGAPTPVTAYFSVVPKIAAMAIFIRFLIQAFGGLIHDWQQIILFVSALSMIVGALGGLTQTNIKRLLAYSSIGHVGYALMGLASGTLIGVSGIIVYFTLYIAMSIGAFACILYMQREGEYVEEISDLSGIAKTKPGIAFALALFMFSMAGIPPLAGFFGKMYVFLAAMESGLSTLAVIGVLSSVVACFYYLKIVKVMYFDDIIEPLDNVESNTLGVTIMLCALFTLLFFIMPTPLIYYANLAAGALFK
ncbi:MAG: NADH-quinone oxidoreductase subunit N, partial [Pseudomonadota bacterium]